MEEKIDNWTFEPKIEYEIKLDVRLFNFAVNVIKFVKQIKFTLELRSISNQVIKAATSVGANYEEAQGASSRKDFLNKVRISLKEIRETNYWLKIIKATFDEIERPKIEELITESEEIKKIIGSIASKVNKDIS